MKSASPLIAGCVIGFFVLIWTSVTGVADVMVGGGMLLQLRTLTFDQTEGTITHSEVVRQKSSKGKGTTIIKVAYHYEVDGTEYTGERFCYGQMGTSGSAWADVQKQFPVGAAVPVYYASSDPADAVLHRGPMGFHFVGLWFLIPFNVVAIGGIVVLLTYRRPQFGPHRLEQTATGWRVRLPETPRTAVFLLALLLLSFIGIFPIAFGLGTNPPVLLMLGLYALLFAVSTAVAVRFASYPVLELDLDDRSMQLPDGTTVSLTELKDVNVSEEAQRGNKGRVTYRYPVRLIRTDNGLIRLATYSAREPAAALASWLRETIPLADGDADSPLQDELL